MKMMPRLPCRCRTLSPLLGAALVAVLTTCGKPTPSAGIRDEPDIRIGLLVSVGEARISGRGTVGGVVDGSVAFRIPGGQEVRLVPDGRAVQVSGPGAGRYERVTFVSLDRSRFVEVNGQPYRGVVEVFAHEGALNVVNELALEGYLAGVVNAELGRRAPNEQAAVEAQVIVARTYALKNRGRFASEGYDLRATVTDQAYGGVAVESERGWDGVRSTSGTVVTYRGELISTFFHSTCGYSTASPDEVFRFGRRLPYLRPISDQRTGGHYCDISPNFRWTVEWDAETLARILRRTVPSQLGLERVTVDEVRDVRVQRTGPSGRVAEARIVVSRGEIPVFGPDIRAVFSTPDGRSLGSTAFQIAVERRGGRVERVTATGAGWGHGVGMCQWGAVGRARAGQDARTIVTTYFPGTTLERWY